MSSVTTGVEPANRQWLRAALLVVIAFCTYLHVPLMSGGRMLVPSLPTVALLPLLFLTVRRNLSTADYVFLPAIAFVLLLSIALSPGYRYVGEKIFGLVQCVMAIGVAVLIVRLMQQLRWQVLEAALLVVWCLIMAGAALELVGVTRDVSDTFRAWAYSGAYTLYDADLRDQSLVGWLRPKLFSVEPSHVTKFFIASINSWLLIRVSQRKAAIAAGATLVMLVIMGSPMLLVSAAITLAILAWNNRARLGARVITVAAVLVIVVIFGAYYAGDRLSEVTERVTSAVDGSLRRSGGATSEERRMIYPYLTLADTWRRWPVFGVGIGGKEVVADHNTLPVNNPEVALGNNAMAEVGIFLGIAGGAWFFFLLLRQARQTGVQRLGMLLLIGALFSQLMGGMVSFQYWGFIALFWGAVAVADTSATEQLAEPSGNKQSVAVAAQRKGRQSDWM